MANTINQFAHNRNIFFTRSQSYYQKDKRILSSHKSYHVGRFFSLIGSGVIVIGLLCKFIINEEIKDNVPVVTVSVSIVGLIILLVGICFLAVTVYKTQIAIMATEKEAANRPPVTNGQQNVTEIIATPHETTGNEQKNSAVTINRSID